ncbi:uncharacterized protein LOC129948184 [Eupeodes corollae]|uniref:uncharacterized protein LOC129948184 n=1 Tax=Eupeodes corollae TaxID=290404 RepID=UPI0024907AF8|nr:uncharacterized protein LOC129948184 [Eupeodes corollae]XP_055915038.1 uncharacterized protein LOC129948184 [Eupeodes corollae]
MKCVFLMVGLLLLQAVYASKNITLSIDVPQESPADVSYVDGKAPEDLKAGPAKKITKPKEITAQAAFIRSSNREIPKDDEIENEEFERFIQKYHSRPTIETVFVSTSPSPLAEDSEELTEESKTTEPQAEVFKQPSAKLQAFERSIAHPSLSSHILPPPKHQPTYAIINQQPNGGGISFSGNDGYIFQSNGGGGAGTDGYILQSNGGGGAGTDGYILQSGGGGGVGGIDGGQFIISADGQFANFVPATFNVAQNAVKTRTYEIRRPAIQKHYYDIEERVIVRPAGSVIVELDRPVAKVPTGETVVAVGGLTGSLAGNGFQQSSQGGFNLATLLGLNGGGGSQQGSGITYTSSVGLPSTSGSAGGFQLSQGSNGGTQIGIGIQQQQGAIGGGQGGIGIQQSQGGITFSTTTPGPNGSPTSTTVVVGTQQQQGAGGASGTGIQQSQSGISVTTTPAPSGGGNGGFAGIGVQQSQSGLGISQGGGANGGFAGIGVQQSQSGVGISQVGGANGGFSGVGIQQSQGGVGVSQGGGANGGFAGIGVQQSQSGVGISQGGGANGGFSGVGIQQSQGGVGISQGGTSSTGIQQSQSGIAISTTSAPAPGTGPTSSTTNIYLGGGANGPNGGLAGGGPNGGVGGVGFSQTQGGSGSFAEGSSAGGFQQSQGGVVYSPTGVPFFPSSTPLPNSGGFSGIGFQSGSGSFAGGSSAGGFQQSQGGAVYSTTGAPFFPSSTPSPNGGGLSGVGFQSGSGSFAGGSSTGGYQQSQGGAVYSTTGAPSFFPSTTPSPNGAGFSGAGFQQSQGGIGVSQGGGFSGAGFQQSQGGIYSTTPAPYLPPSAPTPTVLIGRSNGGFSGAGFQQSQGGIGLGQGGSQGGFAGFQQSQGGIGFGQGDTTASSSIGLVRGGSLGGGEIIYSTTSSPSYSITSGSRSIILRPKPGGGYPFVSTTTGGPITISTLSPNGNNGNSFVVQANSNSQSQGSISSTTTTERSFAISRDASAFARGSSSGSNDPFKITVGEPNFSYPPYVEISSNGSPLGHLKQQPYTQTTSHDYPRMRYQGKLLTGEVRIEDGLGEPHESQQHGYGALSSHHQNYESQATVAEIPPNTPQEEETSATVYKVENPINQHYEEPTAAGHHHQFEGSSKQPIQDSQIHRGAHQQPDQIYQHHFQRTTSQPIVIPTSTYSDNQHVSQHHAAQPHAAQQQDQHQLSSHQHSPHQHSPHQQFAQLNYVHPISSHPHSAHQHHAAQQQAYPQSTTHYVIQEQKPIERANYQSSHQHHNNLHPVAPTSVHQQHVAQGSNQQPIHEQHAAQLRNQHPNHHNLVAEIRHQQPSQVSARQQQSEHHQPTESTHSKQQVTESLEEPIEVSEVHSSTHQQPTLFQQQVASPTANTLEPYSSGQRQYKQRGSPLKYTQDPSLNVTPKEHTVYFNNNLEHTSARSQNLELPPQTDSLTDGKSAKNVESSTLSIETSPTASSQRVETTTQCPTYASVLAQGKPGILYAPPRPVVSHHSPGHKQHFVRFNSDGSSLFSPFGRQLQLVYSQSPRAGHPHNQQSHTAHPVPTSPIEPVKEQTSVTNKGYQIQAQLPITRQSQIELNSSSKPASASEPQITRSRSHAAASHQTSARYEAISSTTPETATTTIATTSKKENYKQQQQRGPQKYRNEQTHGAITLRSGRTYGDHRVIASSPAPSDGGAASESVQTRRIVVNHPFQTIQEVVEREPFTNIHQVTVNAPAKQVQLASGLQEGQQKSAAYRAPAPYKVAALLNHPHATLSFHHGGSH